MNRSHIGRSTSSSSFRDLRRGIQEANRLTVMEPTPDSSPQLSPNPATSSVMEILTSLKEDNGSDSEDELDNSPVIRSTVVGSTENKISQFFLKKRPPQTSKPAVDGPKPSAPPAGVPDIQMTPSTTAPAEPAVVESVQAVLASVEPVPTELTLVEPASVELKTVEPDSVEPAALNPSPIAVDPSPVRNTTSTSSEAISPPVVPPRKITDVRTIKRDGNSKWI